MSEDIILNTYRAKGYPGTAKLYKILRNEGHQVTLQQIKDALTKQKSYQLHKRQKKKIKAHMVAFIPNQTWLLDLLDMSNYSHENNGYKWILLGIDVFTRRAFARPLKNKSAESVLNGFKEIIEEEGSPERLLTDNGSEFINSEFQQLLKKHKIFHETNEPGYHPALGVIDRLSRTIKEKIFKYFTDKNTTVWIKRLQHFIEGYNHTPHLALGGIEPINAEEHVDKIKELNIKKNKPIQHQFKIGMMVRIRVKKGTFKKGYKQIWSTQIYHIKNIKGVNAVLDNGKSVKLNDLQEILEPPADLIENAEQEVEKADKKSRKKRKMRKEGIEESEIVEGKRKIVPTFSDSGQKMKTKTRYWAPPDLTPEQIQKILQNS